ncbi:DinB family protein [Fulvivirgaceae bacterium BMA10]|uniref:DinB family protein n=1 Tax=Splendidivirga corallicola TaxID=3051826 RepID=A0ABT8KNB1_9BACT|nr:DinB family protein [Fulvivirgaceae bacterium BMA10]
MKVNKKIFLLQALLSFFILEIYAQNIGNEGISDKERANAISYLKDAERDLLDLLENLSIDQWNFRSAAESWSIAEVCQHLLLVEEQFFHKIESEIVKSEKELDQHSKYGDNEFMTFIRDRSSKVKTTHEFEPRKSFKRPGAFIKAFKKTRRKTIAYLVNTKDDLRNQLAAFSPNVGDIDGYQWFLFITAHNDRHNAQIAEIKKQLNFPG